MTRSRRRAVPPLAARRLRILYDATALRAARPRCSADDVAPNVAVYEARLASAGSDGSHNVELDGLSYELSGAPIMSTADIELLYEDPLQTNVTMSILDMRLPEFSSAVRVKLRPERIDEFKRRYRAASALRSSLVPLDELANLIVMQNGQPIGVMKAGPWIDHSDFTLWSAPIERLSTHVARTPLPRRNR